MELLPNEIFEMILGLLDLESLFSVCLVDKRSYGVTKRILQPKFNSSDGYISKEWCDKLGGERFVYNFLEGKEERWFKDDRWHRMNGPAKKKWFSSGQIKQKMWFKENKKHCENGPAEQHWHENGIIFCECWRIKDKMHREDGPAYQTWYKDGRPISVIWYKHDKISKVVKHPLYHPLLRPK